MRKNFSQLLVFIFLLQGIGVTGQEPFYWQLTEEDGLPSMTIYQLHQDKKGFMWFGTENGICRYDGKEMETYYHPDLLDNEILTIQEDSWGRIWFKNLAGQLAYVGDENIKIIELQDSLILSEFCIVENYLVSFFIKYGKGYLKKYHIEENGKLIVEHVTQGVKANIQNLQKNRKKIYSVGGVYPKNSKGANYQILEYDCNKNKIIRFNLPFRGRRISNINIISNDKILVDMGNNITILKIDSDSLIIEKKIDQNTNVNDVFEWGEKLYVVGENGISNVENLLNNRINKNLTILNDFKFNQATVDTEGNIWLGTRENGLIIISAINNFYTKDNSNLYSNSVYCIHPHQEENIIIGQDNGVISFIQNNEISNIKLNPKGRIRVIQGQSKKRFWLGGDNFPLTILSNDLTKIRSIKTTNGIKAIALQNDEFIWVATSGRGLRFSTKMLLNPLNSEEIEYLGSDKFKIGKEIIDLTGLLDFPFRGYSIYNGNELLWVGSSKGIYFFRNENLTPFLENEQHISYSVSAITQSKDSTIWVSTQAHGVLGIKNDSVIFRLDENSGLATNNCNNLFYDEYNNLWIGSKKGLHKLNLNTYEIDIINKYDGMPTNEISAIYAKDSIVWVGTQKGLMEIPYSAIQKNKTPPPVHITNVAFWEKDTTLFPSYDLKYNQNNINIEFVGITFRNRGNTNYQYRMIGLDTNWVSTTTRFARYPLLNPGDYEFQVKAINEDGFESVAPAKIQLIIHQPWWQTWWFYLLAFVSGVGLIVSFFYRRFQRIRKEEQQQQEFDTKVNDLRMMALQAQMNPHFVFNALSAIQKFLTTDEQEQAMIYLARFAQLIRNIFEQSKEKLITLEEEFEFLKLYLDLEKLRFKDKVKINFDVDKSIAEDDYDLQIPPLLIQPILENAFKHGLMHKEEGGELKIEFSKNDQFLFCNIEDNGVGREMAEEMGEGKLRQERPSGLKTAKERLAILNQSSLKIDFTNLVIKDLIDNNQNPLGTRVEIKIKYNNHNE